MITLATGDTFQLRCGFKASATTPTSLAGYAITSAVKTSDGVRHMATVTLDAQPSVRWYVRIDDTANWPAGDAEWDCKIVKDGIVVHTEKRAVSVTKSVTP